MMDAVLYSPGGHPYTSTLIAIWPFHCCGLNLRYMAWNTRTSLRTTVFSSLLPDRVWKKLMKSIALLERRDISIFYHFRFFIYGFFSTKNLGNSRVIHEKSLLPHLSFWHPSPASMTLIAVDRSALFTV